MQVTDNAATTQLAAYSAGTRYSDFPAVVGQDALRPVFNILGCMLGGARHEGVEIAGSAPGRLYRPRGRSRRSVGGVRPMPCTPP